MKNILFAFSTLFLMAAGCGQGNDASKYSAESLIPKGSAASTSVIQICNEAADCKDDLPPECGICSNGQEECVHDACVDHRCERVFCEDPTTAAGGGNNGSTVGSSTGGNGSTTGGVTSASGSGVGSSTGGSGSSTGGVTSASGSGVGSSTGGSGSSAGGSGSSTGGSSVAGGLTSASGVHRDPLPCEDASQCTGALPDICSLCSDGSDACAHFACVQHKCEIVICEDPTITSAN